MKNVIITLFMIFLLGCNQEKPAESIRGYDDERLAGLKESRQFNYDRSVEAYDASKNPILSFFGKLFQGLVWFLSNIFGYLVIITILVLLIWFIISRQGPRTLTNEPPEEAIRSFDHETLAEIDFQPLIDKALNEGDYRLAIRYTFLHTLKSLNLQNQIKLKDSKTNQQYYFELKPELKPGYQNLLRNFEFVWYGEFPADKALYSAMALNSTQLLKGTRPEQDD